ncbi:MAG TPA: hypothetical protein VF533_21805, partial [Solirubrobacteraceae bacterium]
MLRFTLLTAVVLLLVAPGSAQAIGLDPGFGSQGRVTTEFAGEQAEGSAIAVDPDGKLVVAGHVSETRFAVARYLPSGKLDPTFDGDGRATVEFPGLSARATAVAVRSDRRVVLAGSARVPGEEGAQIAVAQLTSDGVRDTGFSGDGRVLTAIGGNAGAYDVALQADGKVVVTGYGEIAKEGFADEVLPVVRYTDAGAPDGTFDGDGIAVADLPGSSARGEAVALRDGGRIVVAGQDNGSGLSFLLAGFTSTGGPDTALGAPGYRTYDVGSGESYARGLVVRQDGSLVLAGGARDEAGRAGFGLLKTDGAGTPDAGFSGDGRTVVAFGTLSAYPGDIVDAGPQGVVVAGSAGPASGDTSSFALARVRPDGTPDPGFDGDGRLTTAFGTRAADAYDIARQPDDKLVVAGAVVDHTTFAVDFAVARYTEDGALVRGGELLIRRGTASNRVTVAPAAGGGLQVRDTGAPLSAGPGCTRVSASEATCTGATSVRAELGAGGDTIALDPALT